MKTKPPWPADPSSLAWLLPNFLGSLSEDCLLQMVVDDTRLFFCQLFVLEGFPQEHPVHAVREGHDQCVGPGQGRPGHHQGGLHPVTETARGLLQTGGRMAGTDGDWHVFMTDIDGDTDSRADDHCRKHWRRAASDHNWNTEQFPGIELQHIFTPNRTNMEIYSINTEFPIHIQTWDTSGRPETHLGDLRHIWET